MRIQCQCNNNTLTTFIGKPQPAGYTTTSLNVRDRIGFKTITDMEVILQHAGPYQLQYHARHTLAS